MGPRTTYRPVGKQCSKNESNPKGYCVFYRINRRMFPFISVIFLFKANFGVLKLNFHCIISKIVNGQMIEF